MFSEELYNNTKKFWIPTETLLAEVNSSVFPEFLFTNIILH